MDNVSRPIDILLQTSSASINKQPNIEADVSASNKRESSFEIVFERERRQSNEGVPRESKIGDKSSPRQGATEQEKYADGSTQVKKSGNDPEKTGKDLPSNKAASSEAGREVSTESIAVNEGQIKKVTADITNLSTEEIAASTAEERLAELGSVEIPANAKVKAENSIALSQAIDQQAVELHNGLPQTFDSASEATEVRQNIDPEQLSSPQAIAFTGQNADQIKPVEVVNKARVFTANNAQPGSVGGAKPSATNGKLTSEIKVTGDIKGVADLTSAQGKIELQSPKTILAGEGLVLRGNGENAGAGLREVAAIASATSSGVMGGDVDSNLIAKTELIDTRFVQHSQRLNMSGSIQVPVGVGARWGQAVAQQVAWFAGNGVQGAELQLNPPHLGPLEVKISVVNDQTQINFSSPHASVREALESGLGRLREMLEANGVELADVNVSGESQSDQTEHNDETARSRVGTEGDESWVEPGSPAAVSRAPMGLVDYFV